MIQSTGAVTKLEFKTSPVKLSKQSAVGTQLSAVLGCTHARGSTSVAVGARAAPAVVSQPCLGGAGQLNVG